MVFCSNWVTALESNVSSLSAFFTKTGKLSDISRGGIVDVDGFINGPTIDGSYHDYQWSLFPVFVLSAYFSRPQEKQDLILILEHLFYTLYFLLGGCIMTQFNLVLINLYQHPGSQWPLGSSCPYRIQRQYLERGR